MEILKTEHLSVQFGKIKPVDDVTVSIEEKKLTSIIGPNGAGKTSFFNILTGLYEPSNGKVYFDGRDITDIPIYEKVRRGLTRTFQILNVFDELTVQENIRIAVQRRHKRGWNFFSRVDSNTDIEEEVAGIISRVRLTEKTYIVASELSHGHKRHLEIGLSLATKPRLLLLDEPMSGLGMYESSVMAEFISDISKEITVVLVEHHMSVVLSISDSILVFNRGCLIAQGTPHDIQSNVDVQEAYLGSRRYDIQTAGETHA